MAGRLASGGYGSIGAIRTLKHDNLEQSLVILLSASIDNLLYLLLVI